MSLRPARLRPSDLARLGGYGLRSRPLRAVLSALGIAIGIAAVIAVVSIPASSAQALRDEITTLGPNLLSAHAGQTLNGQPAALPEVSIGMVRRIGPVTSVSAIGTVDASVRRTDRISEQETSGLAVSSRWAKLQTSAGARDYQSVAAPGRPLDAPLSELGVRGHFAMIEAMAETVDWLAVHPEGHRRAVLGSGGSHWVQA